MNRAGLLLVAIALGACSEAGEPLPEVRSNGRIQVTGPFEDGDEIPTVLTCDGAERSPALRWERAEGTESYAVVVHDVDADDFVHWVVWGIPPQVTEMEEGDLPGSAVEGTNSFGDVGYGGPCPPPDDASHTYLFTVLAVGDGMPSLEEGATGAEMLEAVGPSLVASGDLRGTYDR
jgi:Raf kinase inhibitor-like YbhB/YbcL family protein